MSRRCLISRSRAKHSGEENNEEEEGASTINVVPAPSSYIGILIGLYFGRSRNKQNPCNSSLLFRLIAKRDAGHLGRPHYVVIKRDTLELPCHIFERNRYHLVLLDGDHVTELTG